MDNAEIVARLEEVTKTLTKEQRRFALSGSYWMRVKNGEERHRTPEIADQRIADAHAKYSDVVARIAAVEEAIKRLQRYSAAMTKVLAKSDDEFVCNTIADALGV